MDYKTLKEGTVGAAVISPQPPKTNKNYDLFFEDSFGRRHLIVSKISEDEADIGIKAFLAGKGIYNIGYLRCWHNDNLEKIVDYGSHSEFFVVVETAVPKTES